MERGGPDPGLRPLSRQGGRVRAGAAGFLRGVVSSPAGQTVFGPS